MAETKRFYCQMLGQELGPMMLSDVMALVRNSEVTREDLVREGDGDWVPAGQIERLSNAFANQLAPAQTPAPAPKKQSPTKPAATAGTTSRPASGSAPSTAAADSAWFCRIHGKEYGPIDASTLVQWITDRRLIAENEVRQGNAGAWQTVRAIPEFAKHAVSVAATPKKPVPTQPASVAASAAAAVEVPAPAPTSAKQPASAKPPASTAAKAKSAAPMPAKKQPEAAPKPAIASSPEPPVTAEPFSAPAAAIPAVNPAAFAAPKPQRSFKDLANLDVDDLIRMIAKPKIISAIAVIVAMYFIGPWVMKKAFAPSPQPIYDQFAEIGGRLRSLHDRNASDAEIEAFANEVLPALEETITKLNPEQGAEGNPILRNLYYAGSFSLKDLLTAKEEDRKDKWSSFDGDMLRTKYMIEGMSEDEAGIKVATETATSDSN